MTDPTYAVIDQGNTKLKMGLFRKGILVHTESHSQLSKTWLTELLDEHKVEALMYSSVAGNHGEISNLPKDCKLIQFSPKLKLPVEVGYHTNETMGSDRIGAAAGLCAYRGPIRVAIDFGTCTTITIVENDVIVNGSISPGRWLRYRALHEFTGRLPLLDPPENILAKKAESTAETLHQGVSTASALEVEALLLYLLNGKLPNSLVVTGGDHPFFVRHLKIPNFADPHLVLKGLHAILLENI